MNIHKSALIPAFILCAGIFTGCWANSIPTQPQDTVPPTTTVPGTTVPGTSIPATTSPTAPTVPETSVPDITVPETSAPPTTPPTEPNRSEMIGSLYTREQLMSMENKKKSYGCGIAKDGKTPQGALDSQNTYGKYGAYFYVPDSDKVYLTFDCGYEYSYTDKDGKTVRVTEQILDVLKENNVQAVFFVTMHYVKSCPDIVRRMIDEGHVLGNHTANHPALPDCSVDKMVSEIKSLETYVKDNFGYAMNLFRPPEGAFSTRSLALTQSLGYTTMNWSFAYADWDPAKQPTRSQALDAMISRAHPGAIYLLHAVSTTNASVLPEMIDSLRQMGYSFALPLR